MRPSVRLVDLASFFMSQPNESKRVSSHRTGTIGCHRSNHDRNSFATCGDSASCILTRRGALLFVFVKTAVPRGPNFCLRAAYTQQHKQTQYTISLSLLLSRQPNQAHAFTMPSYKEDPRSLHRILSGWTCTSDVQRATTTCAHCL